MNTLIAFLFGLAGACVYRWRGSSSKYKKFLPRPINQLLFALPFAYFALSAGWFPAFIVWVFTTLFTLSGHGNSMDLAHAPRGVDNERYEMLIFWLRGKVPEYWYDVMGLAVSGMLVSLPLGVAIGNPLVAVSGALKAPAYMIGWFMHEYCPKVKKINGIGNNYYGVKYLPRHLDLATEIGEFLTGFLMWGSLWLLLAV